MDDTDRQLFLLNFHNSSTVPSVFHQGDDDLKPITEKLSYSFKNYDKVKTMSYLSSCAWICIKLDKHQFTFYLWFPWEIFNLIHRIIWWVIEGGVGGRCSNLASLEGNIDHKKIGIIGAYIISWYGRNQVHLTEE